MSPENTPTEDVHEAAENQEKPKLTLEVNVESPGSCQRHVSVTISRADIERYLKEAYDELAPKAEVAGFRPGRAPRKLVEARFKEQVSDQVKGSLLMDSLSQVSDENDFSAISEPDFDFDAVSLPDDGPLTFEFDIEVRPDFDMPDWKGLKLERPTHTYSDDDISGYVKKLLSKYSKEVSRPGAVEANDRVVVDITIADGDKQLPTIEQEGVRAVPVLSLRDATIEHFADLIVGAERGDTRSTKVTISDGASQEEMRGKELDVSFTIRDINYEEIPKLNSNLLDEIGGFEDEDELREAVSNELNRQLEYAQQRRLRAQITEVLTKDANWDLPPELVKRQSHRELERAVLELQSSGFDMDSIRTHANQIRQNSQRATETALKEHFIFERIAEDEEIEASDKDYDMEIAAIAMQSDESPRRIRARLEKRGQMDALRNQIIERKVIDLICSEADFTDVPLPDNADEDTFALDTALAGSSDTSAIPEAKHGGEAEGLRQPADRS